MTAEQRIPHCGRSHRLHICVYTRLDPIYLEAFWSLEVLRKNLYWSQTTNKQTNKQAAPCQPNTRDPGMAGKTMTVTSNPIRRYSPVLSIKMEGVWLLEQRAGFRCTIYTPIMPSVSNENCRVELGSSKCYFGAISWPWSAGGLLRKLHLIVW